MISQGIDIIRRNWPFYVFYILASVILLNLAHILQQHRGALSFVVLPASLLALFLQGALALSVFRSALFGISFAELPPNATRFGGLFELIVKAGVLLLISGLPAIVLLFWAKHAGLVFSPRDADIRLTASGGAMIARSSSVVFSYAGTWLPASVYHGDLSLGAALTRGSKIFRKIFPPLAAMIFVTSCLSIALSFVERTLALPPESSLLGQMLLGGAFKCVAVLVEMFYSTFTAVILSYYYLRSEGIEGSVQPPADNA